jgi:PTS system mannose-specific IIA component
MASILLVAHAPLATALKALASHAYAECSPGVTAVDVPASASLEQATDLVSKALASLDPGEALVLTDAFGATPCNAAMAAVDGQRSRVVAGVNVPMLWRTLCYANLPLPDLVGRAVDGGRQGVMQVAAPRRQNQPNRPSGDDPESNPDQ